MDSTQKVFKPKLPASVIATAVLLGIALLIFVIFGTRQMYKPINQAILRGTVTNKEFVPAKQREEQVIIGRDGNFLARTVEGEFILTVEVPRDGVKTEYKVYMPDRAEFDKVNVGDPFDVGPYLVPPEKTDQPAPAGGN